MMRPLSLPSKRRATSCSVLALATVLVVGATPAAAQFVGTIDSSSGIDTNLSNNSNLVITGNQAVINWTATNDPIAGNQIVFLPDANSATFSGASNFAVLNRVTPGTAGSAIYLGGSIQSLIGGEVTGGTVYFYSPNGIVVGNNASINVGSLGLTTLTIGDDGNGNWMTGFGTADAAVTFGPASNPNSYVRTNPVIDGSINALNQGSYVALVAPRVEHHGRINVNGSAALVAAEAATIQFSPDGLFSITVTTGTAEALKQGVVSSGTITGPAGDSASGDYHRAYLVAVPKNDALTMAITQGGSLGFDIAGVADVVGNTVVLSAGYNISGGSIQDAPAAAGSGFKANLSVTGANVTSALVAAANGNADIRAPLGQSSNFASDVTVRGVDRVTVGASGAATTLSIGGNLDLSTATTATGAGQSVSSGYIDVYAEQNASLTVNLATNLTSNATGGASSTDGVNGGNGLAGDINVFARTGGKVLLAGVTATANGTGGLATALGANGGNGTGGDVSIRANGAGSSMTINGNLLINANGWGGDGSGLECQFCDGDGGIGRGGTVDIWTLGGGTLDLLGENISATTSGFGGDAGSGDGGLAFGGAISRIYADGIGSVVTMSGGVTLTSNATGGNSNSATGGEARAGVVGAFAQNGGYLAFDNNLTVAADATGGSGSTGGGDAYGGDANVYSLATLQVDGALTVSANATGGTLYFTDSNGFSAGHAFGGDVDVFAQNGLLTLVGAVDLSTDATGGQASNNSDFSGDGTGGTTRLFANAGGSVDLQSTLDATAIGRGGSDYYGGGIGGDGQGGDVRVQAAGANASITVAGDATLDASGEGSQSSGGDGTGGTVWADSFGAATASIDFLSDVTLLAEGHGGGGGYYYSGGNGGNGQGGQALLQASAGSSVSVGGNATVSTDAFGGYSFDGFDYDFTDVVGGSATGGESRIGTFGGTGSGGTIDIDGDVFISADGSGGGTGGFGGSGNAVGGNGTGGSAHLITTLGNITIGVAGESGSVNVSADGRGGDSSSGTGGNGIGGGYGLTPQGGFARIEAINGDITIEGHASVSADGVGGNGNIGGDGIGSGDTTPPDVFDWTGGAHIFAQNGNININGGADVSASGIGGDGESSGYYYGGAYGSAGGDGGDGTGGWASIHAANGAGGASSISIISGNSESSGFASVMAEGTGGSGGNGYQGDYGDWGIGGNTDIAGTNGGDGTGGGAGGAGGRGGDGIGGVAVITAASDNGNIDITTASASAAAFGGDGGDGGMGGYGGGGGNGGTGQDGPGGDGGNGGNGGAGGLGGLGGSATGGQATIGTESGGGSAFGLGLGNATYGSITISSSATGGRGGDGGSGGFAGPAGLAGTGFPDGNDGNQGANGPAGDGGNGGSAQGGASTLLVRGSVVTVSDATLDADATGGDGGDGGNGANVEIDPPGMGGIGGNAIVGGDNYGMGILASGRFQLATQRGTLNAGTITGTAIATGGLGSTNGTGETRGQSGVLFSNADGYIGSLSLVVQADVMGAGAFPDLVSVRNGEIIIDDAFSFVTSGNLSLFLDNADLTADSITWNAADFVPDVQNGTPGVAGTFFANSFDITTGNNFLTTAHLDSVDTLTIFAPGAIFIGNVTGDNSIVLEAQGGQVAIGNVLAGGGVDIDALTYITTGNITGNGAIDLDAGTSIGTGNISNDGNTTLHAGTSINIGSIDSGAGSVTLVANSSYISGSSVTAGTIYADSGSDIFLGNLTATGDIELVAVGDILVGNALAGESIDLDAGGYVDGGNMTAGDSVYVGAGESIDLLDVSAGIVNQSNGYEADYNVGLLAGTTIETGDIAAFNSIGLGAQGNIYTGSIDAGNIFLALGGGDMSFGAINSGGPTYLADDSMIPLGGDLTEEAGFDPAPILAATPVASGGSIELRGAASVGNFQAAAGTTLTSLAINSGNQINATSGGNMDLGNLFANNDVRLTSGGNIITGSIDAGDDVALVAAGSILTLDIFAYDDVSADAGTTLTSGDITGNSIDLFADGNIATGDLLTQEFFQGEAQLFPGASITVVSGGNIATDTIDSIDGVYVSAAGSISTGTIDAEDFVELFAGGNITAGTINSGSYIDILSDTGLLDLDDLHAVTQIDLESDGSLQFGDATADDFNFEMGGSVNGGNIDAITHADGHADGAIVLENITVTGPPSENDFSVGITSLTSIVVENVDGFGQVGFATLGDLTTGNLTAGGLVMTLASGDIVTGSITTDTNGRVYMADGSMYETGLDQLGEFNAASVLALSPVPTGGSINIGGAVSTGQFQAAAGDDFVSHAITADSINASAGGTAAIDGLWSSPSVFLASRDINITANGRIDGGSTGLLTLNAVNDGGGAVIGDGVTGPGYALSNAEFGRLSSGTIRIVVGGNGGDADTLIGDLTITGPLAGSNIESNDGGVEFITLQEDGAALDGTLRVAGDVVATGFGPDNYLGFYTQNFELDAATGLISITGNGGALAGTLELYASRIHVAESAILDQLAADPQYAGYREDLNQAAAVQRPEGVIRAANFDIEFGGSDITGPYTLFVQNMGTTTVPAGFLLNAANIVDDGEGPVVPGSIDMAINGQIITASGTLTGIAVRDLLVSEFGTAPFVEGSTINGCTLTGSCSAAAEPPRVNTPTRTDVPLNDDSGLGDGLFGNEGDIDDGLIGDAGDRSSPIEAPNPLFDSRPLGASDDVDDPVSGAGNPSLYGATDEDGDVEICDGTKDEKCKPAGKGDGK